MNTNNTIMVYKLKIIVLCNYEYIQRSYIVLPMYVQCSCMAHKSHYEKYIT